MEKGTPKHTVSFIGFLLAFVGAILFSTKAILVKKAFADLHADAQTLLTLRMLFSLPFYLATAFVISANKSNRKMSGREWFAVVFLGICGYYLSSLFDFIGLQ